MGAWGTGSFENDDAMDWVADLQAADDLRLVHETLARAADAGDAYLEMPEGAAAVAAAEVVAALLGAPGPTMPEEARDWVTTHASLEVPAGTVGLAVAALARVRSDPAVSEILDCWKDSDHLADWLAALDDLERRLRPPSR